MKKELEALDFLKQQAIAFEHSELAIKVANENYNIVNQALQRLEAIDNASPSEALSAFKSIELTLKENRFLNEGSFLIDDLNTIKQALLKAEESEKENAEYKKALKLIFEKNVNTLLLELAENVDEYNERIVPNNGKLTQEEFDLLKRWAE